MMFLSLAGRAVIVAPYVSFLSARIGRVFWFFVFGGEVSLYVLLFFLQIYHYYLTEFFILLEAGFLAIFFWFFIILYYMVPHME